MMISGNQTALRELFTLLDNTFKDPFKCYYSTKFACGCQDNDGSRTSTLVCKYQDKWFEDNFGCSNYIFDIEYNGNKITKATLLHHDWPNANILNGCVQ